MEPNLKQTVLSLTKNADYQRIAKNFFSLGIIQVTNYLVPLLLLPYLLPTLGLAQYGVMVFAQTIIGYFESVMLYGFYFTAVQQVSQNNGDKEKQNKIVGRIMIAKIILATLSISLLLLLAFIVPRFEEIRILLLFGILYCIAHIFHFDWFFMGIQEMKNLTILNLVSRLFSIVWVFSMVKTDKDVAKAFLSVPIGYLITGICSLCLVVFKYKVKINFGSWKDGWEEIKNGFHFFYSQLMIRFYSADINIAILGFLADSATVGIYALAHRIFSILMLISHLVTVTAFPYLSGLFANKYAEYRKKTFQMFKLMALGFGFLAIIVFVFSGWIVGFINGQPNALSTTCLRLLCLSLFMSPFLQLINQVLVLHGRSKWLPILSSIAVVANLSVFFPAYTFFNVRGLAITNNIVFTLLMALGFWAMKKEKIIFDNKQNGLSIE